MAFLPRLTCLLRTGAAALPRTSAAARCIGTQTPLWRDRQLAAAKRFQAPSGGTTPQKVVKEAYQAAEEEDEFQCARLLWTLKSGPYDADVKAAINAPLNEDGRSLLQAVAAKGLLRPLGYLLDMAANCARKDRLGLTALHEAAQNGQNEAAQLLLTRGRAPSNARDAAGQTPLQLAMEKGSNSTVQTLMRFGANVKLLDASKVPEEAQKLMEWTRSFSERVNEEAAQVQLRRKDVKSLGNEVPHHIVAPKLVLTPIGYCPVNDDGEVYQLKRGVRFAKRRQGPSAPRGKVNWYCPRG
ncbi:unnamed protein product [Durusdinium trenchii]|uniref:Uncharacterized protein n=1 Tax=Durusdinium trenchii TaxID=1381693 RepID=A0ABP0PNN8_9DINO